MNIVLGVCGSIAAYRAADLARDLMRRGFTVRVCLTDSAQKFVTAVLFETLTGQSCLTDTFTEPIVGKMAHIDWARWADLILVAPATANTINKLAAGIGDDMLTTVVLASTCPLVIAPAMNPQMYVSGPTQNALQVLSSRASWIVEPKEGDVACGEHGQGKLAPNLEIVEAVASVASRSRRLEGRHVLITSGPTQEPIDDVRFLGNRSSGKMGAALARAALLMGAKVTVVSGPVKVGYPLGAEVVRVRTALEMLEAANKAAAEADFIIGAAAVADYRPANPVSGKIRRTAESLFVELMPNPDIIAELARAHRQALVVAFAAEPDGEVSVARAKLVRKGVFAVAINDVSQAGLGFEAEDNSLTLITPSGPPASSGRRHKLACALWLFEALLDRATAS